MEKQAIHAGHQRTVKVGAAPGKGLAQAERQPTAWCAISPEASNKESVNGTTSRTLSLLQRPKICLQSPQTKRVHVSDFKSLMFKLFTYFLEQGLSGLMAKMESMYRSSVKKLLLSSSVRVASVTSLSQILSFSRRKICVFDVTDKEPTGGSTHSRTTWILGRTVHWHWLTFNL